MREEKKKDGAQKEVKRCSFGAGLKVCLEEFFGSVTSFSFWDAIPSSKLIIYYRMTKFHEATS